MTIYYLDPEDGSDAGDGLSFATRKKHLLSATTPMAAGDELRVIASPVANLGVCDWTDNSRVITIPAGLVKLVDDANTGFTRSANVTGSTNTERKSGATSSEFIIAAAFTSGNVAHKALPATLDLSAFSFVGFWLHSSVNPAPLGSMELRLCSDATGDVPVATIPLDDGVATLVTGNWNIVVKDFGAALPSAVNSISLYANTDPGTTTLRLNNVVASKGKNAADHLSLLSAVGKQTTAEPEWYCLNSLSDTSIATGASNTSTEATNPPRPYRGITEAVATYALRGLAPVSTAANRTPVGSGTAAARKRITGGWDRAAMGAQSGVSWYSGRYLYGSFIDALGARNYWSIEKFGGQHFATAFINQIGVAWNVQLEGVLAATPIVENGDGPHTIDIKQIWGFGGAISLPSTQGSNRMKLTIGRIHGNPVVGGTVYQNTAQYAEDTDVVVGKIDNNAGYGFASGDATNLGIVNGTVFANNLADLRIGGVATAGLIAHNCTLGSATPYSVAAVGNNPALVISAQDGDPSRHTTVRRNAVLTTDTAVRHTASGVAWKYTLTSALIADADNPMTFKLAEVAVRAGVPVTVKAWMRRDNLNLLTGIMVRRGRLAGVADARAEMTASINTWEEITLVFTPTAAGVIPLYGYAHGALASAWFDDVGITQ